MPHKEKNDYLIQSVSHALDLLEQFQGQELGVTELSARLHLQKNRVFRLLATLMSRGYVEQNPATENYRLGLKPLGLAQMVIRNIGLLGPSRAILREIVDACDETAYISTIKDGHIIYLDIVETTNTVRVVPRIGFRLPAYCTAAGKVYLAFVEGLVEKLYTRAPMQAFTSTTITALDNLKLELSIIARRGYAIDNEEHDTGVRCVAVPVRDYTSQVVGALSISGPSSRFSGERISQELAPLILREGDRLSEQLGFKPPAPAGNHS